MRDNEFEVEESKCHTCGKIHNRVTGMDSRDRNQPKEGDVAVCIVCGAIEMFDDTGKTVPIDDEILSMLEAIDKDKYDQLIDAQKLIRNKGI